MREEREPQAQQRPTDSLASPVNAQGSDLVPYPMLATLQEIALALVRFPIESQVLGNVQQLVESRIPGTSLEIRIDGDALGSISTPIIAHNEPTGRRPDAGAELRLPLYYQERMIGSVRFSTTEATLGPELVSFLRHLVAILEASIERMEGEDHALAANQDVAWLVGLASDLRRISTLSGLADGVEDLGTAFGLDAIHLLLLTDSENIVSSVNEEARAETTAAEFLATRTVQRALTDGDTQLVLDCRSDPTGYLPLWREADQAVVAPLVDAGTILGFVVFELPADRSISRDYSRTVDFVSNILAEPILRMTRARRRARREFAAALLSEVAEIAGSDRSKEALLNDVTLAVRNGMGWSCAVGIVDDEHIRFPAVACAGGFEPASWLDDDLPIHVGVTGRVARTGEPAFLQDVAEDPDFLESTMATTSEICLPLRSEPGVVGVFNVETIEPDRLDLADFDLATGIASLVELGLGMRRLREQLDESAEIVAAVQAFVDVALGNGNSGECLTQLITQLRDCGFLGHAVIWLRNGDWLRRVASTTDGGDTELQLAAIDHEIRPVLDTGVPLVEPGWTRGTPLAENAGDVRGLSVLPIQAGGDVAGVLVAAGDQRRPLDHSHQEALHLVAGLAGLCVASDVSEREIVRVAGLDPTTDIPNVEFARRELQEWVAASAEGESPFSLLLVDIDDFRAFNVEFGREAGDECLRRMSNSMLELLRGDDLIARYGSDEFIIGLPDTDEGDALGIATRLSDTIGRAVTTSSNHHLGVSIGIATFPGDGQTVGSLFKAAEAALAAAKSAGGGQPMRYHDLNSVQRGDLVRRWYVDR